MISLWQRIIIYFTFTSLFIISVPLNIYIIYAIYRLPSRIKRSIVDYLAIFWSLGCLFDVLFQILRIIRWSITLPHILCQIEAIGATFFIIFFSLITIITSLLRAFYVFKPVKMKNINNKKWAYLILLKIVTFSLLLSIFYDIKWIKSCVETSSYSNITTNITIINTGNVNITAIIWGMLLFIVCILNIGIYSCILIYLKCLREKYIINNNNTIIPLTVNICQGLIFIIFGIITFLIYFNFIAVTPLEQTILPVLIADFIFFLISPTITLFASKRFRKV